LEKQNFLAFPGNDVTRLGYQQAN